MGQKQQKQQKNTNDTLANQEKQSTVLEFNIAKQNIDDQALSDLAKKVATNKNLKVLKLDLSQNVIGDQGVAQLDQIGNCQFLTDLTLNLSQQNSQNKITDQGLLAFYELLKKLKNIEILTLDLSTNNIIGEKSDILSLLTELPNLKKLTINLNNNQLGYRGMYGLSKIILDCRDLRYLNIQLKNNGFDTLGLEQFVMIFKYLIQLQHIIMDVQDKKVTSGSWIIMFVINVKFCTQLRSFVFQLENNNMVIRNTLKNTNKYFHKMKFLVKADFKLN
ncbi:hypothetical protein ABPG72_001108 [Tetrahymena utriculariae]